VLAQARGCLAESATRGSTPEERHAAEAWLLQAARDGRPAAPASAEKPGTSRTRPPAGPARRGPPEATNEAAPSDTGATHDGPPHASLALEQVEACSRLHRRIRVRTEVIRRLLEPDPARDELMEVVL
jgi:hypothetical protein